MENIKNSTKESLRGLCVHLNQQSPGTVVLPLDINNYLDNNTHLPVEDWDDICNGLSIMTTSQAVDTLHDDIISSDNFASIEHDARQAQMLLHMSRSGDYQAHQLYWDTDDIYDDDAIPLNAEAFSNRLDVYLSDQTDS